MDKGFTDATLIDSSARMEVTTASDDALQCAEMHNYFFFPSRMLITSTSVSSIFILANEAVFAIAFPL